VLSREVAYNRASIKLPAGRNRRSSR